MDDVETFESLKKKKHKSKFEEKIVLNSPQLKEKLVVLRDVKGLNSWDDVKIKIDKEFNIDSNPKDLEQVYIYESTEKLKIDGYARKYFDKYASMMGKRYERLYKITDRAMNAMEQLFDLLETADGDKLEAYTKMISMIKPLVSLNQAVLAQLEFVREEQEKISLELEKSARPMNEEEIRAKIYDFLPEVLHNLEINRDIIITNKDLLK